MVFQEFTEGLPGGLLEVTDLTVPSLPLRFLGFRGLAQVSM